MDGKTWATGIDVSASPCVTQTASGNLQYYTGRSAQGCAMIQLGETEGGRAGQEGGRGVCAFSRFGHLSDSLQPQGLQPSRLLCPWDSPGENTEWVAMPSSRPLPDPGVRVASPVTLHWQVGPVPLVAPGKPRGCICFQLIHSVVQHYKANTPQFKRERQRTPRFHSLFDLLFLLKIQIE